jgi:serpin B
VPLLSRLLAKTPTLPVAADFATDLYRHVAADANGNVVISPWSVRCVLALALEGARDVTAAEIRVVLGWQDEWQAQFLAWQGQLLEDAAANKAALRIANSAWIQAGHPLLPAYADAVRQAHHAILEAMNFADSAGAVERINRWVMTHTDGQIPKLLEGAHIAADTLLVLVNAIYFRAEWRTPFSKTKERPFYPQAGPRIRVPTMQVHARYTERSHRNCRMLPVELRVLSETMRLLSCCIEDVTRQRATCQEAQEVARPSCVPGLEAQATF